MPVRPAGPASELDWADLRPVLDEEVSRLPQKYRAAFVLCHVQGRTNEEAARLLGCPKGTILSRLSWARERLRSRLTRRGITLSAGSLAGLLPLVGLPPTLLAETARAAAVGQGAVSVEVVQLTQGVLRAMWITKLKAWASVLLAVAVLSTAGLFTYRTLGAEDKEEAKKGKTDRQRLQGTWVIVSAEKGGRKLEDTDEEIKGCTLTIKGDKATLTVGGRSQEATITLGPDKTPKHFDTTVDEGGGDEVHLGIYKLEGDTFTLCKSHPPQERPMKFATTEGEKWPAIFVFKRQGK